MSSQHAYLGKELKHPGIKIWRRIQSDRRYTTFEMTTKHSIAVCDPDKKRNSQNIGADETRHDMTLTTIYPKDVIYTDKLFT